MTGLYHIREAAPAAKMGSGVARSALACPVPHVPSCSGCGGSCMRWTWFGTTAAAALVLLSLLLPRAGEAEQSVRLTAAGATLDVQLERGAFRDNGGPLLEWVRRSADIVARYYDRFPAANGTVRVVDRDGDGVHGGTTWANPNALIRVQVGRDVT